MRTFDILIIGAGASGLCAAINAKRHSPKVNVAIIERLPRAGKKILATGNGRCNLSNLSASEHPYKNKEFAAAALGRYDVQRTLDFFKSLGLLTYTDSSGRIYPMSNTAAGVLDALRFEAQRLGIEIICDIRCEKIKRSSGVFLINGEYGCKRLVIACGGQASPSQGSDGSGYALLRSLGHSITPLYPSLVQLTSPDKRLRPLKGVRVHDAVISVGGVSARGEILFTDYGLSGIAAMEISRTAARLCAGGKTAVAMLDLAPSLSEDELCGFVASLPKSGESTLNGILPKAVGALIIRAAGGTDKPAEIARRIKRFRVELDGTKGFDSAQVTCGGADVREFDSAALRSLRCENLWCAGEVLDVDGGCGGFNLQWAWSSGLTVGEEIVK